MGRLWDTLYRWWIAQTTDPIAWHQRRYLVHHGWTVEEMSAVEVAKAMGISVAELTRAIELYGEVERNGYRINVGYWP